ncbi:hypothetical protein KSF73_13605 [Burkholderiaceae bacterium DAT-1]|nr:hypothetical protein [Burkholderiaceae bacterium DAT-1]
MRSLIIAGLIATSFAATAIAATPAKPADLRQQRTVPSASLKDLSADFIEFYEKANAAKPGNSTESDSDRRWNLYKQIYNFQLPQTEAETRASLESAWPRYASLIKDLEIGFDAITPKPLSMVNILNSAMICQRPLKLHFVAYVGSFQNRVWAQEKGDSIEVNIPLETPGEERTLAVARVLSRAVYNASSNWQAGQPRNFAEFMIGEGVVLHGMRETLSGRKLDALLGVTPEQLQKLEASRKSIAKQFAGKLTATSFAELQSGEKLIEARYLGYLLVEGQLKKVALADLLRQAPSDLAKGLEVPVGKFAL